MNGPTERPGFKPDPAGSAREAVPIGAVARWSNQGREPPIHAAHGR